MKGLCPEAFVCQQLEIRQHVVPLANQLRAWRAWDFCPSKVSQKVVKEQNLSQPLEIAIEETNSAGWT